MRPANQCENREALSGDARKDVPREFREEEDEGEHEGRRSSPAQGIQLLRGSTRASSHSSPVPTRVGLIRCHPEGEVRPTKSLHSLHLAPTPSLESTEDQ